MLFLEDRFKVAYIQLNAVVNYVGNINADDLNDVYMETFKDRHAEHFKVYRYTVYQVSI